MTKSSLSAVLYLQISEGLGDPIHGISMPRLEYVLREGEETSGQDNGGIERSGYQLSPTS